MDERHRVEIQLALANLSLRPRTWAPERLDWVPKAMHDLIATESAHCEVLKSARVSRHLWRSTDFQYSGYSSIV